MGLFSKGGFFSKIVSAPFKLAGGLVGTVLKPVLGAVANSGVASQLGGGGATAQSPYLQPQQVAYQQPVTAPQKESFIKKYMMPLVTGGVVLVGVVLTLILSKGNNNNRRRRY